MILKEKVFKIISQVMDAPFEKINEDSSPDNLKEWDSFKHMNLILALEEEFKIRFTDEEIAIMANASKFIEALKNKGVPA